MRLRSAQLLATTAATAAVAAAGIALAAPASADTAIHCTDATENYAYGCDTPAGSGGPFTFSVDRETVTIAGGIFGSQPHVLTLYNVRYTCATAAPAGPGAWSGSDCGPATS